MQIGKIRYVGTTNNDFTNNVVYDVLSWATGGATIKNTNNIIFAVNPNGPDWKLVSVHVLELKQLYP